jgi:hypothetical protein
MVWLYVAPATPLGRLESEKVHGAPANAQNPPTTV